MPQRQMKGTIIAKASKIRHDTDKPLITTQDIFVLQWVGEQGAASVDNLQELLSRSDMRKLLRSRAGATPKEAEKLSASRVLHIVEDRWTKAGMVNYNAILDKRWIWPTRRALHITDLPFSPYLPANMWHLYHVNRIRLYLEERFSVSNDLLGYWESARWYGLYKRYWRARKKADTVISVPDVYRMSHTPAGLWSFWKAGDAVHTTATLEVKVSAQRPEALKRTLSELAIYGGTVWYFVEMDPKQEVFSGLMKSFEKLDDQCKPRFSFYDLAEPGRLVYRFER